MTQKQKFKFALVTHSTEIADMTKSCIDSDTEVLIVKLVDLDQAVPTANELLEGDIEVIIGHGGTGAVMAQRIGQPVVNIPITHLCIIRAFLKAKKYSSKIAITSYASPRDGIDILERLLDIKTHQIIFHTTKDLKSGIKIAMSNGFNIIVGGGVSRKMATEMNGQGIIIEPNANIVNKALIQARAMAASRRKEKEHIENLQTILQITSQGVIGIDNYGRLTLYNQAAEKILGINLKVYKGRSFSRHINKLGLIDVLTTGKSLMDQIINIDNKNIVVTALPITMESRVKGVIALFWETNAIQNIDRKVRESLYIKGLTPKYTATDIKGRSAKIKKLLEKSQKYARTEATILIQGETGTGKELLAHTLHNLSARKEKPFVAVNCAALPETLLESELFGYEEGAFTGAKKGGKIGLFELANTGTIFLDEIADIPTKLQVRLLRVLESKEVMRIGGDRIVPVNVRVISSTYKDLREEVKAGRFRVDLYYRLAILKLNIHPLRKRLEDINDVIENLLYKYNKDSRSITNNMLKRIREYEWPGNIRELCSVIESYLILLGNSICNERIFFEVFEESIKPPRMGTLNKKDEYMSPNKSDFVDINTDTSRKNLKEKLAKYEKAIINDTLKACHYNKKLTAKTLGISVNTLWRKMDANFP